MTIRHTASLTSFLLAFIFMMSSCVRVTKSSSNDPLAFLNDTTYFDSDWKQTLAGSNDAQYFRTFERKQSDIQLSNWYISNGQLLNTGLVFQMNPLKYQGLVKWYFDNGQVQRIASFDKGVNVGEEFFYKENGSPESHFLYKDGEKLTIQKWDEQGSPLLKNGTGKVSKMDRYNTLLEYEEFKDFVCIEHFVVRQPQEDTIYLIMDEEPFYRGGMKELYLQIGNSVEYPKSARRAGVEGLVYVMFIVDENGKVVEPKITRGIHPECDAEALQAVTTASDWIPASHKGKNVKSRLVLPVFFRLSQ